jgi:cyclophilin family peptidyl-prolyl cis-trans isomerase/HEAT repeat protein
MKPLFILPCALALGCGSPTGTKAPSPANNKWSDARLAPVLEAQDHRDSKALLVLLNDTSAVVREAAAMAFASVQDTTVRKELTAALHDQEAHVRRAAAWALGFVADTTAVKALAEQALKETDTAMASSLYAAAFHALITAKPDQDAQELIDAFVRSSDYQRTCIAEVLRRLPKEKLAPVEGRYIELVRSERDPYVKMLLLGGLKNFGDTLANYASAAGLRDPDPVIRVASLRAYAAIDGKGASTMLFQAVDDSFPAVRSTAVELLQSMDALDGDACWTAGQESADVMVKLPLYGLAVKYGDEGTRNVAMALLESLWQQPADPYVRAALVDARADAVGLDTLIAWMQRPWPAVARQAAFVEAVKHVRATMMHARHASRKGQYAQLARVLHAAFDTGDAGLIAAAADELLKEQPDVIATVLDSATEAKARAVLHPIRDLETLQELDQVVAKRDGLPTPLHQSPPFNHPIDRARLATLKNGKEYRITTTKGDIVIAIEPDAAPGTCTAFDSLVTSGFYNGKYFHRVVPDFVAQGGCPRGDGYGAMDWTMRTEVGLEGFDTGAVGIASSGRDTESCQFFFMLAPAPHLDGRYTRFAHVLSGMAVAQRLVIGDRISRVEPIH